MNPELEFLFLRLQNAAASIVGCARSGQKSVWQLINVNEVVNRAESPIDLYVHILYLLHGPLNPRSALSNRDLHAARTRRYITN